MVAEGGGPESNDWPGLTRSGASGETHRAGRQVKTEMTGVMPAQFLTSPYALVSSFQPKIT